MKVILLGNQWVKEKNIDLEVMKYLEMNKSERNIYQNYATWWQERIIENL